ncbi:MAG: DUF5698 domain-containing protein [Anaerolineaceae bacterium]|nr:DUF5698 domain-containing protein [Anaerolineaceae bacterium]
MESLLSINAWLGALGIFFLRVLNIAIDTVRFMMTIRGKKGISWILGFLESVLFVLIIGSVLSNVNNVLNIIGYAAGFATGNVIGMEIEKRLALGFAHVKVVSSQRGQVVAETLRNEGYAVTEIPARGKDGKVTMLDINLRRKDVKKVELIILQSDENAFITVEEITPIKSGFWHS